jgi:very-short-patch-repair endonuclease
MRDRARAMRKAPTDAERILWSLIRRERLGLRFRRQAWLGKYIADFVCFSPLIVVEVDGSQHANCDYDAARDAAFRGHGYTVVRFWNNEVFDNPDGVCEAILRAAGRSTVPRVDERAR